MYFVYVRSLSLRPDENVHPCCFALRGLAVGTCCYQHKALQISSQQKEQRAPQTSDCPDVKRSPVFSPRFFFSPLSFSGPTHVIARPPAENLNWQKMPKAWSGRTQATRENRTTHRQAGLFFFRFVKLANAQRPALYKPAKFQTGQGQSPGTNVQRAHEKVGTQTRATQAPKQVQ